MAAKLEAHPGYNSDSHTKTWYAKGAPGITYPLAGRKSSASKTRDSELTAIVDADGDTQMSGINQLAALLINAIGKA